MKPQKTILSGTNLSESAAHTIKTIVYEVVQEQVKASEKRLRSEIHNVKSDLESNVQTMIDKQTDLLIDSIDNLAMYMATIEDYQELKKQVDEIDERTKVN